MAPAPAAAAALPPAQSVVERQQLQQQQQQRQPGWILHGVSAAQAASRRSNGGGGLRAGLAGFMHSGGSRGDQSGGWPPWGQPQAHAAAQQQMRAQQQRQQRQQRHLFQQQLVAAPSAPSPFGAPQGDDCASPPNEDLQRALSHHAGGLGSWTSSVGRQPSARTSSGTQVSFHASEAHAPRYGRLARVSSEGNARFGELQWEAAGGAQPEGGAPATSAPAPRGELLQPAHGQFRQLLPFGAQHEGPQQARQSQPPLPQELPHGAAGTEGAGVPRARSLPRLASAAELDIHALLGSDTQDECSEDDENLIALLRANGMDWAE